MVDNITWVDNIIWCTLNVSEVGLRPGFAWKTSRPFIFPLPQKSSFTLIQHWTTRGSSVELQDPCKKSPFPSKVGWIFGWVSGFPDFWSTKVSTGSGHGLPRTWQVKLRFQWGSTLFQHLPKVYPSSKLFVCFLSFLANCFKLGFYFQWDDCKLLVYSNNNWITTSSTTSKKMHISEQRQDWWLDLWKIGPVAKVQHTFKANFILESCKPSSAISLWFESMRSMKESKTASAGSQICITAIRKKKRKQRKHRKDILFGANMLPPLGFSIPKTKQIRQT